MKKYYFDDGYIHKCENLNSKEIAEQEAIHGELKDVMLSGVGCVRCEKGILPVNELSNTIIIMNRRKEVDYGR